MYWPALQRWIKKEFQFIFHQIYRFFFKVVVVFVSSMMVAAQFCVQSLGSSFDFLWKEKWSLKNDHHPEFDLGSRCDLMKCHQLEHPSARKFATTRRSELVLWGERKLNTKSLQFFAAPSKIDGSHLARVGLGSNSLGIKWFFFKELELDEPRNTLTVTFVFFFAMENCKFSMTVFGFDREPQSN